MRAFAMVVVLSSWGWASSVAAQTDADRCAPLAGIASCTSETDASGARFVFVLPGSWNGRLVVYAKPSGGTVAGNRDVLAFRDALVREGYAFAYPEAPDDGYKIELEQDREAARRFVALVGRQPWAVYLVGESRGAVRAIDLVETYPEQYAGAVAQCAPALGFKDSTRWRLDVRVLFDWFFGLDRVTAAGIPRILETPLDSTANTYAGALYGLVRAPGSDFPLSQIASVKRFPEIPALVRSGALDASGAEPCVAGRTVLENMVVSPILFLMNQDRAILSDPKPRSPYDNSDAVYSGSVNDEALNAGVERFVGNRSAMNHQAKYYTPTGDLHVPVLLLHNRFDPLGTLASQAAYEELVASAGRADEIARWTVDRAQHCWFTPEERLAAFRALVTWAEGGPRPASGPAQGSPPSACP